MRTHLNFISAMDVVMNHANAIINAWVNEWVRVRRGQKNEMEKIVCERWKWRTENILVVTTNFMHTKISTFYMLSFWLNQTADDSYEMKLCLSIRLLVRVFIGMCQLLDSNHNIGRESFSQTSQWWSEHKIEQVEERQSEMDSSSLALWEKWNPSPGIQQHFMMWFAFAATWVNIVAEGHWIQSLCFAHKICYFYLVFSFLIFFLCFRARDPSLSLSFSQSLTKRVSCSHTAPRYLWYLSFSISPLFCFKMW